MVYRVHIGIYFTCARLEGTHVSQQVVENHTVTTVSTLKWVAKAVDHQSIFTCGAAHPALSGRQLRTNFTLNVLCERFLS
jgi:hypothetical protein